MTGTTPVEEVAAATAILTATTRATRATLAITAETTNTAAMTVIAETGMTGTMTRVIVTATIGAGTGMPTRTAAAVAVTARPGTSLLYCPYSVPFQYICQAHKLTRTAPAEDTLARRTAREPTRQDMNTTMGTDTKAPPCLLRRRKVKLRTPRLLRKLTTPRLPLLPVPALRRSRRLRPPPRPRLRRTRRFRRRSKCKAVAMCSSLKIPRLRFKWRPEQQKKTPET
jgi:hypothetical protein